MSIAAVGFALAVYPVGVERSRMTRGEGSRGFSHEAQGKPGWTSPYHDGINLGPVVLMCENYRSGMLWRLTRRCAYLVTGLRRAGFANGWL